MDAEGHSITPLIPDAQRDPGPRAAALQNPVIPALRFAPAGMTGGYGCAP